MNCPVNPCQSHIATIGFWHALTHRHVQAIIIHLFGHHQPSIDHQPTINSWASTATKVSVISCKMILSLPPIKATMLSNATRFCSWEKNNSMKFSNSLRPLVSVFVNHRGRHGRTWLKVAHDDTPLLKELRAFSRENPEAQRSQGWLQTDRAIRCTEVARQGWC